MATATPVAASVMPLGVFAATQRTRAGRPAQASCVSTGAGTQVTPYDPGDVALAATVPLLATRSSPANNLAEARID